MEMMFDEAALPLQLVLDGDEEHPNVDLIVNRAGELPRAFENAAQWIPRLGSEAMVELAASLLRRGSEVMRFDIRDLRLNPIDRDDAERISSELIESMLYAGADAAERLLNSEFRDYLINSFEVLVDKRRATVAREGVVFASNRDRFLGVLREAWAEAGVG